MPFILLPWEAFIVGSLFGWKLEKTGLRRFRMAYIETAKGPLALNTPIATVSGWTTMGEIEVGDCVFNNQGKPTVVTAVSPVFYNRKCFKLKFSCGDEIIADSEHEWITSQINNVIFRPDGVKNRVSTLDIFNSLMREGVYNHTIPHWNNIQPSKRIVGCDPVESTPVRCLTVASNDHMFLAGKNLIPTCNSGKTPMAYGIGLKGLTADSELRAEIYSCATFQAQAMVGFRDACAFVDQSSELSDILKTSGGEGKEWNIYHPESRSFFRVISSEKKGQSGPRPHMYIADELHEHRDGTVIGMLEKGFKFRQQPLGVEITNSGVDVNSFCFERHEMCRKISIGVLENDDIFAYICALDEDDITDKNGEESEQYLDNEKIWLKVNPSLEYGLPGYDYIRKEVKKARGMPSQMSLVKRLNFCQWVAAENPWLSGDLWFGCQCSDGFDDESLRGRKCWGGLDLSSTQDLTALALIFEPSIADPFWRLKVYFWIPGDDLEKKEEQDHVPYTIWRDKGYITALPGKATSKSDVVKRMSDIAIKFNLQGIAYDRARINDVFEFADQAGIELSKGKWNKEKRQWDFERGDGIKMMPFGQEPRSMEPAISKFEALLADQKVLHDGNPALNWCAANAVAETDKDLYRKINKKKSTGRVDGIVAAVMACGVTDVSSQEKKSAYDGLSIEQIRERMM